MISFTLLFYAGLGLALSECKQWGRILQNDNCLCCLWT